MQWNIPPGDNYQRYVFLSSCLDDGLRGCEARVYINYNQVLKLLIVPHFKLMGDSN